MDEISPEAPSQRAVALALLESWDRQQTAYIRHRDLRFASIVGAVRTLCGPTPRVLDIACGPGSLSRALRAELPEARILGCDKDPLLMAFAREVFAGDPLVEIVTTDLDHAEEILALPGEFDAAISSTALHWLQPGALSALYFALAQKIRPGGVFLNGDHFYYDAKTQPGLRRLAAADDTVQKEVRFGAGVDDWEGWWAKATAAPGFADAAAARAKIWEKRTAPAPKVTLGYHLETLRSAGFAEVGTVWQFLDDWVLAAIR